LALPVFPLPCCRQVEVEGEAEVVVEAEVEVEEKEEVEAEVEAEVEVEAKANGPTTNCLAATSLGTEQNTPRGFTPVAELQLACA